MAKDVTIMNGKTWRLNEINSDDLLELDREMVRGIRALGGDPKQLNRIANMASQKIGLVRALIHAERIFDNTSRDHNQEVIK